MSFPCECSTLDDEKHLPSKGCLLPLDTSWHIISISFLTFTSLPHTAENKSFRCFVTNKAVNHGLLFKSVWNPDCRGTARCSIPLRKQTIPPLFSDTNQVSSKGFCMLMSSWVAFTFITIGKLWKIWSPTSENNNNKYYRVQVKEMMMQTHYIFQFFSHVSNSFLAHASQYQDYETTTK